MERSPFFKPITKTNAILTLVQSIMWFIMSATCFIYYSEAITLTEKKEYTYRNVLERQMYELYLRKDFIYDSNYFNITPKGFIVFCGFYLIISFILINTSIVALYCLRKVNEKQITFWQYFCFITWIILSLCQSLLDLVFFCLLLDDYNYFAGQILKQQIGIIPTAIGIVMTIVARGFVLWLINLVMNVITMLLIIQEYQQDRNDKKELFPRMERRSTLRRSTVLSDDLRPFPSTDIVPAHVMTGRSNSSYISDRYDPFAITQTSLTAQAAHRPPQMARFNPPAPPAPMNRYDNGNGGGGLRRSGSGMYGGR